MYIKLIVKMLSFTKPCFHVSLTAADAQHPRSSLGDRQSAEAIVPERVQCGHAAAAHDQVLRTGALLQHSHRILPLGGQRLGGRSATRRRWRRRRGTGKHLRGERRKRSGFREGIPQGKWCSAKDQQHSIEKPTREFQGGSCKLEVAMLQSCVFL